jgi:hypothetical protein
MGRRLARGERGLAGRRGGCRGRRRPVRGALCGDRLHRRRALRVVRIPGDGDAHGGVPRSSHRRRCVRVRPGDLRVPATCPGRRRPNPSRSARSAGGRTRIEARRPGARGSVPEGRERPRPAGRQSDAPTVAGQAERRTRVALPEPADLLPGDHGPGAVPRSPRGRHGGGRTAGPGGGVGPGVGPGPAVRAPDPGYERHGWSRRRDLPPPLPILPARRGDRRGRRPHRGRLVGCGRRSLALAVPPFVRVQGGHPDDFGLRVGLHRVPVPGQAVQLRGLWCRPAPGDAVRRSGQPAADPGDRNRALPARSRRGRRVGHLPGQCRAPRVPDAQEAEGDARSGVAATRHR